MLLLVFLISSGVAEEKALPLLYLNVKKKKILA